MFSMTEDGLGQCFFSAHSECLSSLRGGTNLGRPGAENSDIVSREVWKVGNIKIVFSGSPQGDRDDKLRKG